MEISFRSKEESKREQERAFLALSKADRFLQFLELSRAIRNNFPKLKKEEINKDNLILQFKR